MTARQRKTARDLRDLIRHAWIHAGYPDCGYKQMTTEQKKLYCRIVGRNFQERQEHLVRVGW